MLLTVVCSLAPVALATRFKSGSSTCEGGAQGTVIDRRLIVPQTSL